MLLPIKTRHRGVGTPLEYSPLRSGAAAVLGASAKPLPAAIAPPQPVSPDAATPPSLRNPLVRSRLQSLWTQAFDK
jgi:hypothetical protein